MEIKQGSTWLDVAEHRTFVVINQVTIDDKIWVHYRNEYGTEFSCYEESFRQRFRENTNDYRKN